MADDAIITDEVLEQLQAIMDNGDSVPARVSNKLVLAAVIRNLRRLETLNKSMSEFGKTNGDIAEALNTLLHKIESLEQRTDDLERKRSEDLDNPIMFMAKRPKWFAAFVAMVVILQGLAEAGILSLAKAFEWAIKLFA